MQVLRPLRDAQNDRETVFQMDPLEADRAAAQEDDQAARIRSENGEELDVEIVSGCAPNQCPWCGFADHRRKTKYKCPQHPQYRGSAHAKGDKVSAEWVPGPRESHNVRNKVPVTPLSVVSAPSDKSFKATQWTEGAGALSGFTPEKCRVQKQTRVKASLGWTVDTQPITFFDNFYTVSFV